MRTKLIARAAAAGLVRPRVSLATSVRKSRARLLLLIMRGVTTECPLCQALTCNADLNFRIQDAILDSDWSEMPAVMYLADLRPDNDRERLSCLLVAFVGARSAKEQMTLHDLRLDRLDSARVDGVVRCQQRSWRVCEHVCGVSAGVRSSLASHRLGE